MGRKETKENLLRFFEVLRGELSEKQNLDESQSFARDRLLSRMQKRARLGDGALRAKAIDTFKSINSLVGGSCIHLPCELVAYARSFITVALERYTTRLTGIGLQETLSEVDLLDLWRFGPGAANGIIGTHAVEKVEQPMTTTSSCVPWVHKLRTGNAYFALRDNGDAYTGITVVHGSRLTTVPKNEDTERTIAIEPSGNMAMQLAAGSYLEGLLRYIGCDITKQADRNNVLAKAGSEDNNLCTIDLKNASDMIHPELVRLVMPDEWYRLLMKIRSPTTELPSKEIVVLNMMSTMGNGFTFPLMTLILISLIYAYRRTQGGPVNWIDWHHTGVFGDDIIVRSSEYEGFVSVLTDAGLIVNRDKSYSDGPFRESCGGDYFRGFDVSPFYVKSLADNREIHVALNQVYEWCAKQGIILPRTIRCLVTMLRGKVHLVPEWCNPDQGLRTQVCPRRYSYIQTKRFTKSHIETEFTVMLACGGYLEGGSHLRYSPRPFKTSWKVAHARLPRGYLHGGDPVLRDPHTSDYIASYVFLALGS